MLRVTIELLPHGREDNKKVIGIMEVMNDGSGTEEIGNYNIILREGKKEFKRGGVNEFHRKELGPWDLVYQALQNIMDYGEYK